MSLDTPLDGTISALVVRALVHGARVAGIDVVTLPERAGLPGDVLDPNVLADPDARLPARIAVRLWQTLPALTGRPNFGLWLSETMSHAPLTVAAWFILSCASVEEGLERALAFQRLLHDRASSSLERDEQETTYVHQVGEGGFRAPSAAIEFGFAELVRLVRRATGRAVLPSRVCLQHAPPQKLDDHRRHFGDRLEFGAARDTLSFDRATLELPVVTADPALGELVQAHALTLLAALPDETSWATRVRRVLGANLARGLPSVDEVARALALPTRTLQRRLQEEGTSFEDVSDDLRRRLAERYLTEQRFGIQQTAFLLGYSDVSAFYRAFARWTGLSPAAFVARASQEEAADGEP